MAKDVTVPLGPVLTPTAPLAPTRAPVGGYMTPAERAAYKKKYPWLYGEDSATSLATSGMPPPSPPDAIKLASDAQKAAMAAGAKRRKKAQLGFTLGMPTYNPARTSLALPARPRSLAAGY